MALFNIPVPIPPGPKSMPNPVREGDTIKALEETRSVLSRLVELLSKYEPKFYTDANGYRFEVLASDVGKSPLSAQELSSPWNIYLRNIGGDWKFGVDGHSDVYDGVTWDKITVTGLLVDPADDADAGWSSPSGGFIFLWGTMGEDGIAVDSIEVKNDQNSLDDIKRVDSSDGKQTHFAHVLGYLWSTGSGADTQWYFRKEAFRHVTLLSVVVNGVLCKIPFEM